MAGLVGGVAGRRGPRVLLLPGRGPPRRRPPAGALAARPPSTSSWPWPRAVRDHPGTTLEFIPTVGPIPEERMELMADMSLAADRPLNWNLLGSLASEEIYEQQLEASDLAARQGRPRGRPGPARHDADAVEQPAARPARLAGRPRPRPGPPGGRGRRPADPGRLRAGAEKVAARAMGVLSDFGLMEVADPESAWVGRSLGEIAAPGAAPTSSTCSSTSSSPTVSPCSSSCPR